MPQPFREALPPLPKRERPAQKEARTKGTMSQGTYEASRGRKVSWKPKD